LDIERQISRLALELVSSQKGAGSMEYRSFCEGLPALLRTAGLAQTSAFLLDFKAGSAQRNLYTHLEDHFRALNFIAADDSLLDVVASRDTATAQYRFYSRMALRVAQWHKRIAQALLEKDK